MNRVLQIPTQVVKQKCLSEGPERHFFLILLLKVIRLGFAKMRCFTAVSCVLLVLLVLVNRLIYNAINAFVVV